MTDAPSPEFAMPDVDYSAAGSLRQAIEQTIDLIDAAITMDGEALPTYVEARLAVMRRVLRGGLIAADGKDGDEDGERYHSAFKDRTRWPCSIHSIGDDEVGISVRIDAASPVTATLPADMFEDVEIEIGSDVVIRLVDSGEFVVTLAADAVPPRNTTNPALFNKDIQSLQMLVTALRRTRSETRR